MWYSIHYLALDNKQPDFLFVHVNWNGDCELCDKEDDVDIGLVESPFQHTCLKHLQDCVVNGD
jgi:hypothetical protein